MIAQPLCCNMRTVNSSTRPTSHLILSAQSPMYTVTFTEFLFPGSWRVQSNARAFRPSNACSGVSSAATYT